MCLAAFKVGFKKYLEVCVASVFLNSHHMRIQCQPITGVLCDKESCIHSICRTPWHTPLGRIVTAPSAAIPIRFKLACEQQLSSNL
jgi:hypothetical protein